MKTALSYIVLLSIALLPAEAKEPVAPFGSLNPLDLYKAAAISKADQNEAMFLFIVADLRIRIDQQLFPPSNSDGEDPGILLGAIRSNLALELDPAIVRALRDSDALIERIRTWVPDCTNRYQPLWTSVHSIPETERASIAANIVNRQVTSLAAFARLLRIPEYWDAYLVKTERRSPAIPDKATTAQAIAIYNEWDKVGMEASKTLARIESKVGIPVLSEKRPNQAPEPTSSTSSRQAPASVTPPAGQEARQP